MDVFARCFLLVFAELHVGGVLALSVPPFHEIERGFYKSTAAVYLGSGLLALAGRVTLLLGRLGPGARGGPERTELLLWVVSVAATAVYLWSLWGDNFAVRARSYTLAWMSGLFALAVSAQSFRLSPLLSIETVLYPLSFVVGALALGSVTCGMLLGHWYLIDQNLSIDPFRRMCRFFVIMLVTQAVLLVVDAGVLPLVGASASIAGLNGLLEDHAALLMVRVLLSPVAAGGIAWMIWKTLQIPQTMAATGLFYVAILAVLVGEFMGRFILFRTSLPL